MKIINKEQFAALGRTCGTDCWNDGHIVRQALETFPNAVKIEVPYVGTGLWCDVIVHTPKGQFELHISQT